MLLFQYFLQIAVHFPHLHVDWNRLWFPRVQRFHWVKGRHLASHNQFLYFRVGGLKYRFCLRVDWFISNHLLEWGHELVSWINFRRLYLLNTLNVWISNFILSFAYTFKFISDLPVKYKFNSATFKLNLSPLLIHSLQAHYNSLSWNTCQLALHQHAEVLKCFCDNLFHLWNLLTFHYLNHLIETALLRLLSRGLLLRRESKFSRVGLLPRLLSNLGDERAVICLVCVSELRTVFSAEGLSV